MEEYRSTRHNLAVSKLPDKCLVEGERKKNKLDELETEEGRDRVIEKTL